MKLRKPIQFVVILLLIQLKYIDHFKQNVFHNIERFLARIPCQYLCCTLSDNHIVYYTTFFGLNCSEEDPQFYYVQQCTNKSSVNVIFFSIHQKTIHHLTHPLTPNLIFYAFILYYDDVASKAPSRLLCFYVSQVYFHVSKNKVVVIFIFFERFKKLFSHDELG